MGYFKRFSFQLDDFWLNSTNSIRKFRKKSLANSEPKTIFVYYQQIAVLYEPYFGQAFVTRSMERKVSLFNWRKTFFVTF